MPFASIAMAAGPEAAAQQPTGIMALVANPLTMMVVIFAIFYLLIIRPQQKRQREHETMLRNLVKGERILTSGGIYGTILSLTDRDVVLQVDDRVKIKLQRSAIADKVKDEQ